MHDQEQVDREQRELDTEAMNEVQGGVERRPQTRPQIRSPRYEIHVSGGTKN